MPEKSMLAIIMINYRTPQLTTEAVVSLIPEIKNVDAQVLIVDNCSGDHSMQMIGQWIDKQGCSEQVRLLESPGNLGFSGGNNYGIKAIIADYYLLLNSDTIIRPGAISTLIDTANNNPAAGMVSPRLEWMNGEPQESCFNFHRPPSEMIRSSGTGVVDKLLSHYLVPQPVCETITRPEWTSFACVLVRKQVLLDIGMMDDDFFMYYEDSEFCFRAKKAGWGILNNPEAKVVHLRGGSSNVKSKSAQRKRLPHYYYESRTKYYYKCFGYSGLFFANICWLLGRSVSLLRELLGNKAPHVCEKEWLDIWINFLAPNRQSIMYKGNKR